MSKRMRSGLASTAAAVLMLTACSGGGGAGEGGAEGGGGDGPVTLDFWAWGSNVDKRVEVWNEENPDIQVNISAPAGGADFPVTVLTAVRAGDGPDMAQAEFTQLPTYVSAGVLASLEPVRDEIEPKFAPTVMETVTFDDTIFGIPQDLGPALLVYRQDLFEQHGLQEPTTWEEFRDLAAQVRELEGSPYLLNFSAQDADLFMGLALQAGAQWWDYSDGEWTVDIDSPETQEVLDFWAGMVEDDLVSTYQTGSPEFIEATASGSIFANISGAWAPGPLMNQYPDTVGLWDAAQIPQWDTDDPRTFARGGSADVILEDTEHFEEAAEFLIWLNASDEGAEGLVEVNKFTAATHGQQIDRDPPALMPDNTEYWPEATRSAENLVTVQWGPNTETAFSALRDALGAAIESGNWDGVLPTVQSTVEGELQ